MLDDDVMADLDLHRYQMTCPQCGTRGELTPHPDRAENQTRRHNVAKHSGVPVADVVTTTID